VAQALAGADVKAPGVAGEAVRVFAHAPHAQVWMVPAEVHDATLVVTPKDGGGVDVVGDGACDDEAACARAEDSIRSLLDGYDNFITRALTRNILRSVRIHREAATIHIQLKASRDQVEAVLNLAAAFFS
jgi:hypothetical protein